MSHIRDNKDWLESRTEEIQEIAADLAETGMYHYFEDFVERMIETTDALDIFFDKKSVADNLRDIYRDHYKSIGGI